MATSGYAPVNGLQMYYEVDGSGPPLFFIPPAFGFAGRTDLSGLLPGRSIISADLQGNGRTADLPDRPISIEQYASDVVGLLDLLGIARTDLLGESYGGNTAALIAIRHPDRVGRVVTYAATFAPPPETLDPVTTRFDQVPTADSSYIRFQREGYERVAPEPDRWPRIYEKVGAVDWKGFTREELGSLRAPILLIQGDHDFVRLEHTVETMRLIPDAELAVIPDASHFALCSEPERVLPVVRHFLEKPVRRLPRATANNGYYPGATR